MFHLEHPKNNDTRLQLSSTKGQRNWKKDTLKSEEMSKGLDNACERNSGDDSEMEEEKMRERDKSKLERKEKHYLMNKT